MHLHAYWAPVARAALIAIAQLSYEACACLGDWGHGLLGNFLQQEAVEQKKFLEELNVRDKAKGNELSFVSVTFLMDSFAVPLPMQGTCGERVRERMHATFYLTFFCYTVTLL